MNVIPTANSVIALNASDASVGVSLVNVKDKAANGNNSVFLVGPTSAPIIVSAGNNVIRNDGTGWLATGPLAASSFVSGSPFPASAGVVRAASGEAINFRNNGNTGDINALVKDATDVVRLGDAAGVRLGATNATPIKNHLSATQDINFLPTSLNTCSDSPALTVTGAAPGDPVFVGAPNVAVPVGGSFFAWVSAANSVTVRFCADGIMNRDPENGTFRVTVFKF